MSSLVRSVVVLLIVAIAILALLVVFGVIPWSVLASAAGRIVLAAAIVLVASLTIGWVIRSRGS